MAKRQDANQDWLRRRDQLERSLREEQERIELFAASLAEQLNIQTLTKERAFGKVSVSTVIRDGAIIGVDWRIEGTVRT